MHFTRMVYFEGKSGNGEQVRSYFGVKFFPTKDKAQFFISDESGIIQDMMSGNIRVLDRTMDELFFGKIIVKEQYFVQ